MPEFIDSKKKLIADYEVCLLSEKITYTRGYIYVLKDKAFPLNIKVGKTHDLAKRLAAYNSDKPFPTADYIYISKVFDNKDTVEKYILDYIYKRTNPTTFSKEWFDTQYMDLLIDTVKSAEKEFN